MMNPEAWTILAVGTALGGLVWQLLRSLRLDMARRFEDVTNRLDRLAEDHRGLAEDHHGLARELSELRGELRGRLDERARPAPR